MMALFDSHCHVDEPKFDDDREDVLTRMAEAGVTRYAVIGSDMATSRHSADFASGTSGLLCRHRHPSARGERLRGG